ncbi:MAG: acetylornithine transaminase [Azospirillum brasilense]|nr:MAG: acetylornithine transaminase [Azospirillum brasilense]
MAITPYLPVYRRTGIKMVRGEGSYLIDESGKRYLDFASGIAVNAFGHSHPHLVEALREQAGKLWHCSNQYTTDELERFSQRLVDATFADSVFFCSSGAEAVEAGMKFMRRYHYETGAAHRHRIITFEGGFHGRTYGGISAGGNASARAGFGQLLNGFDRVAFNDLAAVERAITANTAGILIEPIQGEGGVRAADLDFLRGLRTLADQHGLLLMCDEVQCGYGRPGSLYAFERAGITPDIVSSAKGIGGGFPLGATLVTERVGAVIPAGSHGSTYGSNPLAMAVGNAVLDLLLADGLMAHVQAMGTRLVNGLRAMDTALVKDVRGVGLMVGLEPTGNAREIAAKLLERGLTTSPTVTNVLRLVPPLNVSAAEIDEALSHLAAVLKE